MRIKIAVSNRHAHLTEATAKALGIDPKPEKWLGIGDNFASDTFVEAGGVRFRVLLPFRSYDQLEVLASDCRGLGIEPCWRSSGQLEGAPTLDVGGVQVPAIVALPHVHVPEAWHEGSMDVEVEGVKTVVLRRIPVFPTKGCEEPILHIDRDEAAAYAVDERTTAWEFLD